MRSCSFLLGLSNLNFVLYSTGNDKTKPLQSVLFCPIYVLCSSLNLQKIFFRLNFLSSLNLNTTEHPAKVSKHFFAFLHAILSCAFKEHLFYIFKETLLCLTIAFADCACNAGMSANNFCNCARGPFFVLYVSVKQCLACIMLVIVCLCSLYFYWSTN